MHQGGILAVLGTPVDLKKRRRISNPEANRRRSSGEFVAHCRRKNHALEENYLLGLRELRACWQLSCVLNSNLAGP
jgi:hypothetical protein